MSDASLRISVREDDFWTEFHCSPEENLPVGTCARVYICRIKYSFSSLSSLLEGGIHCTNDILTLQKSHHSGHQCGYDSCPFWEGRAAFPQLYSVPDGLLEIDSSSPILTDRSQQWVWPPCWESKRPSLGILYTEVEGGGPLPLGLLPWPDIPWF